MMKYFLTENTGSLDEILLIDVDPNVEDKYKELFDQRNITITCVAGEASLEKALEQNFEIKN